jgi:hypothetical protein
MTYQQTSNAKSGISKFTNTSNNDNARMSFKKASSEGGFNGRSFNEDKNELLGDGRRTFEVADEVRVLKISVPNPRYEVPRPKGKAEDEYYNSLRELNDPIKNPKVLIMDYDGESWVNEGYSPSVNGSARCQLKECIGFHSGPNIHSKSFMLKDRCFTQAPSTYGYWNSNFVCMDLCWMDIEKEKIENERQTKYVVTSLTTVDSDNQIIMNTYEKFNVIITTYKNRYRELERIRAKIEAQKKQIFDPSTDNNVLSFNATISDAKEMLENALMNSNNRWIGQKEKFLAAIANGSDYDINEQYILFLDRDANLTAAKNRLNKTEEEKERYINKKLEVSNKINLKENEDLETSIRNDILLSQASIPACPNKMIIQRRYGDEKNEENNFMNEIAQIREWEIKIEELLNKGENFEINEPLYTILTTYNKYKNIVYPTITSFNAKDAFSIKIKESKKIIGKWKGIIMELSAYMPRHLHNKVINNVMTLKRRAAEAVINAERLKTKTHTNVISTMNAVIPETIIDRRGKIKVDSNNTSPAKFNNVEGVIIPNINIPAVEIQQVIIPVIEKEEIEDKVIYDEDFSKQFDDYYQDEDENNNRRRRKNKNEIDFSEQEDKLYNSLHKRDSGLATTSQSGNRSSFGKPGINRPNK